MGIASSVGYLLIAIGEALTSKLPEFRAYKASATFLLQLLKNLEILNLYMLDTEYRLTDADGWSDILMFGVGLMPLYESDVYDCDDFAIQFKARISEKYKINSVGIVFGETPSGYHAWNFVFTPDGVLHYIEPQTGEMWDALSSLRRYKGKFALI